MARYQKNHVKQILKIGSLVNIALSRFSCLRQMGILVNFAKESYLSTMPLKIGHFPQSFVDSGQF